MSGRSDPVRDLARERLYAGYLLAPGRSDRLAEGSRESAAAIFPASWAARGSSEDRAVMRAEVPVVARTAGVGLVEVTFRWLHGVERRRVRAGLDGLELVGARAGRAGRPGRRYEAIEREVTLPPVPVHEGVRVLRRIEIRQGSATEWLEHGGHRHGGRLRSWRRILGSVEVTVAAVRTGVYRLGVEVRNETPWSGTERQDALRSSFIAGYLVLAARGAGFGSVIDPEPGMADVVASCRQSGCRPVLLGTPGEQHTVLVADAALSDHPHAPARAAAGDPERVEYLDSGSAESVIAPVPARAIVPDPVAVRIPR